MLYQQCLNRLSKVQGTTITEGALLEVPGFSEFVLSQIKNRMDNPPRKRKADESEPSKPAKKRQSGSSKQHRVEATVSDVFDHADNPEVVEIIAKQQQEARVWSGEGFKLQPGSGAFAIVKALSEESPPSLRKEELKDAASKYSSKSMKETGPFSAWKEMTILLRKKMVIRTGKGAEESFLLTSKGKEVAENMEGPNKKKEEFLREIRSIGKILPHIEKALLVRFKSNEDLKTSLQMQTTREGKENMLRQVPIDEKRVLPRYVCQSIIEHYETKM